MRCTVRRGRRKMIDYGPGDEQTWGSPTGHPNDPRTEDDDEAEGMLLDMEEATELMAMARDAIRMGDMLAARSIMYEAAGWLSRLAEG
jgi:hypothetical protein